MSKTYTYHQDPGHGWIAVPVAELADLGILGKISHYSYLQGGIAYLEEDCDAAIWHIARTTKDDGVKPELIERHVDNTPIRNYPSYTPASAMQQHHWRAAA